MDHDPKTGSKRDISACENYEDLPDKETWSLQNVDESSASDSSTTRTSTGKPARDSASFVPNPKRYLDILIDPPKPVDWFEFETEVKHMQLGLYKRNNGTSRGRLCSETDFLPDTSPVGHLEWTFKKSRPAKSQVYFDEHGVKHTNWRIRLEITRIDFFKDQFNSEVYSGCYFIAGNIEYLEKVKVMFGPCINISVLQRALK